MLSDKHEHVLSLYPIDRQAQRSFSKIPYNWQLCLRPRPSSTLPSLLTLISQAPKRTTYKKLKYSRGYAIPAPPTATTTGSTTNSKHAISPAQDVRYPLCRVRRRNFFFLSLSKQRFSSTTYDSHKLFSLRYYYHSRSGYICYYGDRISTYSIVEKWREKIISEMHSGRWNSCSKSHEQSRGGIPFVFFLKKKIRKK